jgi:uncharacterized membrane protein
MTQADLVFALHATVALLMIGLGWPLWRNKVPPNPWYGFRTPATLADERVWYPVNRVTGLWLIGIGLVTLPVVAATWLAGWSKDVAALTNLVPIVVGLAGLTIFGIRMSRRLSATR